MIRSTVNRVLRSNFARAVAVLSSGQLLSAAIPILAAPVLGRLYLPEEYGALGAYLALGVLFGSLSTLQLQHAVLIEESEADALNVASLVLTVAAVVASMAAVVALALFTSASGGPFATSRWWVFGLPLNVFAAGLGAAVSTLANRVGRYADMARIPIIGAFTTVTVSITTGILGWGVHGLFASYFAAQALTLVQYILLLRSLAPLGWKPPSFHTQWYFLKRYRRFALFSTPSELLGAFNLQAPVFALGAMGAVAEIGSFGRARQLIGMPLQLLGHSIGQVFRQRAAKERSGKFGCRKLYERTGLVLLAIGAPPTALLMLFAPEIFRIVLGPNWVEAGVLTRIIAPALLLQFVCSPLSSVFYIMERQKEELGLALVAFSLQLSAMALGAWVFGTGLAIVTAYSGAFCAIYVLYIGRGWQISGTQSQEGTS